MMAAAASQRSEARKTVIKYINRSRFLRVIEVDNF